jgi:hypothetical protein
MTTRCSICRLDPRKLEAINAALRSGASLEQISERCGLSKSSLHRHSKHIPDSGRPEPPKNGILAPPKAAERRPAVTREETRPLLERVEQLWNEIEECMALAKEPITLRRPDGSTIELPCDVRARASVIREGRGVLDLLGHVTGEFRPGAEPQNVTLIKVIALPKADDPPRSPVVEGTATHLDPPSKPLSLPTGFEALDLSSKSGVDNSEE